METIERIQYHAARIITGTWKGTSTNNLYGELGWESLTDRRWSRPRGKSLMKKVYEISGFLEILGFLYGISGFLGISVDF